MRSTRSNFGVGRLGRRDGMAVRKAESRAERVYVENLNWIRQIYDQDAWGGEGGRCFARLIELAFLIRGGIWGGKGKTRKTKRFKR